MTPAELTEARESLHLSQRELAEVLGVHPNIVNRWERGRARIPPYLHLALAHLNATHFVESTGGIGFRPRSRR